MKYKINVHNDCRDMPANRIINTILSNRGIEDKQSFLDPQLEDWLLPLDDLKNINKAANTILEGIKNGNRFGIYADVDLDGISSAAIMKKYLNSLSVEPNIYINKGKAHGVTPENLSKIIQDGVNTLIIVDSLDNTAENYKTLNDAGVRIVIADHHAINPNVNYEDYVTLVSSQNGYGNPNLCGAGTTWKLCCAIDRIIGGYQAQLLIDLAMAGTIGDMMDLSQNSMENRAIVNAGIENLNNKTLIAIGGGYEFNSKTVAFSVAPRTNAVMRLNKNEYACNAFLSDDEEIIKKNVRKLNECKNEQNKEVNRIYKDAMEQCNKQLDKKMMVVIIDSKYSINGLLGNKLMEVYKRPILVLTERFDKYQGSMRACGVKDFRKMLEDTGLCKASGHELASGVEIYYSDFDKFRAVMEEKLDDVEFSQEINVDAELYVEDVNMELIRTVKYIDRISGMNFPSLEFLIELNDFHVEKVSKGKHLCIRTPNMLFIKWNFNDDEMYERLQDAELLGDSIKCIGTLDGSYVYKTYNKMICDDIIIEEGL